MNQAYFLLFKFYYVLTNRNYPCREIPPTEEEISKNLAIAKTKEINAAKIEEKRLQHGGSVPAVPAKGKQSFPSYPDLPSGDPERFLYHNKDDFNK